VVYQIKNICDEAGIDCPNIISESGRATVAHYSVLVTNVLDTNTQNLMPDFESLLTEPEKLSPTVKKLVDIYKSIDRTLCARTITTPSSSSRRRSALFNLGYLNLNDRAVAEWICSKIVRKINGIVEKLSRFRTNCRTSSLACARPISPIFRCSSRFPTSWAIDQLFPIVPIQRLNQKPDVLSSIADITLRFRRRDNQLRR